MQSISSAQNPKIRNAIRLHDSRGRRQQGRIIIFGVNEIRRAESSGTEFVELFACENLLSVEARQVCSSILHSQNVEGYDVPETLFAKIAFGNRTDGLLAIARRPSTEIKAFDPSANALVIVLQSVEKPGNIGAVFRSADAASVSCVFLADPVSDVYHPNAIRSSLGSVFTVNSYCDSSERIIDRLAKDDFTIVTTLVDANRPYFTIDLTGRTAIVLGNESTGLTDVWRSPQMTSAGIPMRGKTDSLNVAVTAAVMVFEAQRQRSLDPKV